MPEPTIVTASAQFLLQLFSSLYFFCLNNSKLIQAFLAGFIGSAAYITALYFKFAGEDGDDNDVRISPFLNVNGDLPNRKNLWYCFIGGSIATIFQYDVPTFVAVQSLILGATWPATVSQFLSKKMSSSTPKERSELSEKVKETERKIQIDKGSVKNESEYAMLNEVIEKYLKK